MVPFSTIKVNSKKLDDTLQIGRHLGHSLQPSSVVGLTGDLGAGKTTLVRGIAAGWNAKDRVSSPTYTLVNIYRHHDNPSLRLFHVDAYRLRDEQSAESIGLSDILDDEGPVLIEWPHFVEFLLPDDRLHITIETQGIDIEQRLLTITSTGALHEAVLSELKKTLEEYQ